MIKINVNQLIEKIAKFSGLSKEEIERRIEAKREKLSGLISFEGAAQIVAAELGIKFDSIKLNIGDLLPGMRKVGVVGKIIEMYGIKQYVKEGKKLKLASFLLADSTGAIRVILWDTKHIELIEKGEIKKDGVVEISNAYVRGDIYNKELHLTNLSQIAPSTIKIENVINIEKYEYRTIDRLSLNARAKIRGNIVQIFKPHIFNFCIKCGKKVNEVCNIHGDEEIENRVLLTFIVDDGTGSIRCLTFGNQILNMLKINDINSIEDHLDGLLGEEFWFEGRVRKNKFRDEFEFVVDDVKNVGVKELIEELQSI